MTSTQDWIQSNDANCLSNRITIDKIALNLLKAAQRSCARKLNTRHSISTLKKISAIPVGALDTLSAACDPRNIDLGNVKGRAHAIA